MKKYIINGNKLKYDIAAITKLPIIVNYYIIIEIRIKIYKVE